MDGTGQTLAMGAERGGWNSRGFPGLGRGEGENGISASGVGTHEEAPGVESGRRLVEFRAL